MSEKTKFILTGAIPMWLCLAAIVCLAGYHINKVLTCGTLLLMVAATLLGVWIHMIWVRLK